MTNSVEAQRMIDEYLERLRKRLRGIGMEQRSEIVAELRSHLLDKAGSGGPLTTAAVASAISGLGDPDRLASLYLTDELLARTQSSRAPLLILRGLLRWAGLSLLGFFVLMGSLVGYVLAGALALCALLKPFHPYTAGLWRMADGADYNISVRLGFGAAPAHGEELLGWYIIPIGLVLGYLLFAVTTRIALRSIALFRTSRPLPARRERQGASR